MTYLLGDGAKITPKYVGPRRLLEVAVSTLVTDRALLLLGVPGTAKTWVSEHLAAAISGDSTLLVQGTAGTAEEAIRYGWNYARLLADGPTDAALVPSPVMRAMQTGAIARVEELTRVPVRRAGRADHRAVREDAAGARAEHRGAGAARVQSDRHGQRPRPRGQRAVQRAAPAVQHGGAADAGLRRRRGGDRGPPGGAARPVAGPARGARGAGRDPPGGHRVPRAAQRA